MDDLISRKALLEELDKWINPCVNCESEFPSGIAPHACTAEALDAGMRMQEKIIWPIYTDYENARIIGSTRIALNLLMVADGRRIDMERLTYNSQRRRKYE